MQIIPLAIKMICKVSLENLNIFSAETPKNNPKPTAIHRKILLVINSRVILFIIISSKEIKISLEFIKLPE